MDKYRIVALANAGGGIIGLFIGVTYGFLVMPQLASLYQDLDINVSTNVYVGYTFAGLLICLGIAGCFMAMKLFSRNIEVKNRYYKGGIVVIVLIGLLLGFGSGAAVISTVMPIYSLINNIQ